MLASALQATGDEAGAEAAARHAVALDPDDADTHSTLGEVLFEQDRHGEAIARLRGRAAAEPRGRRTRSTTSPSRACAATTAAGTGEQFEAAAMLDPRHDIARHNILHTGPAGRSYVYRRFAVGVRDSPR